MDGKDGSIGRKDGVAGGGAGEEGADLAVPGFAEGGEVGIGGGGGVAGVGFGLATVFKASSEIPIARR